jgi:hypothetical protein
VAITLLVVGFPADADECDRIVENLLVQTPGLKLDKRVLAEGVGVVYLRNPQATAI